MKLNSPRPKAAGAFLLIVSVAGLAAAVEVRDSDFKGLVNQDLAHLAKSLKDGSPDKKGIIQSKAAAMMVALYAQDRMAGKDKSADAKMATLRDGALKVAEAVAAKKYKDAFAAAKLLGADMVADPAAKLEPVDLSKKAKFDIIDLMSPLKKASAGGLNVEADIKEWSEKLKDASKVPALAARVVALAEYTELMPTDTGAGKKSEANWKKYAKMMKDAAADTYELSKQPKPDLKKLQTAIGKINASCTECHNVFKTGG